MADLRPIGDAIKDVAFYAHVVALVWLCLHYGLCS